MNRKVAYLDTDVWIRLARNCDELAAECLQLCEMGIRRKRMIFPLSHASCAELVQQAPSTSRTARVGLMQSLSEGVAFRDLETIRRIEAEAAVPHMLGDPLVDPDVSRLFAGVQECMSDMTIAHPFCDAVPEEVMSWARHGDLLKSLSWYVRIHDGFNTRQESKTFFEARREILSSSITDSANAARDGSGKPNRQRAFTHEAATIFQSAMPVIRAVIEKLPDYKQRLAERARTDPGGQERLRELIRAMPSVANETDLFAQRALHPERKHRGRNDYWDIEHAIVPSAYSDAWVTLDGNLATLVRGCETPQRRGCTIFSSMNDFRDWLRKHA